jgi:serine/threonine protein phosphatase PrpC
MEAPLFFFDQDASRVEVFAFAGGTAAVYSERSPADRGPNEDAAALIPCPGGAGILAVADGLGGLPGGARAARTALETLAAEVAKDTERTLREALLSGFEMANQAVLDLGLGSATTLAACEVTLPHVRTYHAGDSPILVFGGKGRLKLETIAHSPVGYAVEAGLLDPEEALHHEARHLVSNILGSDEMRVDMSAALELSPRDTVVLSSDGLVDNLHLHEIGEIVRSGTLEEAVESLVTETLRRMSTTSETLPSKPDDLTIVVYRPEPG